LIKILTEPKNALVKQYQKKFDFDNVKLKFTEDALKGVARQAVQRKVGARGLMMILEELLLDAMYTLPSQKRVKEFVITSEMVERRRAIPGRGLAGIDARLQGPRNFVRSRPSRLLGLEPRPPDKLKFVGHLAGVGRHTAAAKWRKHRKCLELTLLCCYAFRRGGIS
jgi:hypothetical protein